MKLQKVVFTMCSKVALRSGLSISRQKKGLKIIYPLLKFVYIRFLVFLSLLLEWHLLGLPLRRSGWKEGFVCVCTCATTVLFVHSPISYMLRSKHGY